MTRHESGLISTQVGGEVLMKLRVVKVSESVSRLLYRCRFAEVTWEALSVVGLIFSGVRHMGGDVHQTDHIGMRPCFGNYRSPVAVGDKDARSILLSQDALRRGNILLKRRLGLLNDAEIVAIFDKNVVNTLPARTICPGAMDEDNVLYGRAKAGAGATQRTKKTAVAAVRAKKGFLWIISGFLGCFC